MMRCLLNEVSYHLIPMFHSSDPSRFCCRCECGFAIYGFPGLFGWCISSFPLCLYTAKRQPTSRFSCFSYCPKEHCGFKKLKTIQSGSFNFFLTLKTLHIAPKPLKPNHFLDKHLAKRLNSKTKIPKFLSSSLRF